MQNKVILFVVCLFLFWPSTSCWSLFNFKEPMLLFSIITLCSMLMRFQEKPRLIDFIIILFFAFIAYLLKEHMLILLPIGLVYLFLFSEFRHKKVCVLFFILCLIILQVSHADFFVKLFKNLDIFYTTLYDIRYSSSYSNTKFFTNLLTADLPRTMLYLPFGIMAVLFFPFFVKPLILLHIWSNMESILWWCLAPFLIQGIWISLKYEFKKTFTIVVMFVFWIVMLALTQGNMGTLLRQKCLIYYLGFIFIGLAVDRTLRGMKMGEKQHGGSIFAE